MNRRLIILSVLFCICLVASNLFEVKIFSAGPLTLTGGFLIFPISYIINDCLSEVYGWKTARFVIILAFAVNLFFVLVSQLVRILPEVPYSDAQEHIDYIFKADLRITCASMAAFLVGSLMNALVMVRMKSRQERGCAEGEHKGFGIRAIVSSLAGESVDSLVFFPIAFAGVGVRNMVILMVTQIILKTAYEVVILPITSRVVKLLRAEENN